MALYSSVARLAAKPVLRATNAPPTVANSPLSPAPLLYLKYQPFSRGHSWFSWLRKLFIKKPISTQNVQQGWLVLVLELFWALIKSIVTVWDAPCLILFFCPFMAVNPAEHGLSLFLRGAWLEIIVILLRYIVVNFYLSGLYHGNTTLVIKCLFLFRWVVVDFQTFWSLF